MAKISNLVIPAVIDTSGIDRGISSIKNKMSRVRGGSNVGIGGGGAGFSSGVTPFGGDSGIGTAAMAAALGGVAAGRLRNRWGGFAGMTKEQADSFKNNNFYSRILNNKANAAFAERNSYFRGKGKSGLGPEYMGPIMPAQMFDEKNQLAQLDRMRNLSKIQNANRRGLDLARRATEIGVAYRGIADKAKLAIGGGLIGAGAAAAYSVIRGAGSRQMEQRTSDIRRFQGTPYYTAARNLKADYYNTSTPTAAQGFFMGGRMGTGGRAPIIERAYTALGDVPSGVATAAGLALGGAEAALVGTEQEKAASLKATQDFYSGTNVSMGGPLAIGLEKLFRKIFM